MLKVYYGKNLSIPTFCSNIFFKLEQRLFFFLRFNEYEDRAVQNMGQLYCHTKPPSASRRVMAHRINDRCNRTGFRRSNALLRR